MGRYLIIESEARFGSERAPDSHALASDLASRGHDVTLFLVQNGVLPARRGARAPALAETVRSGVAIRADEFALRERGIASDALADGVQASPLDVLVDRLADGDTAIWH